jgi:hypothetical protein
LLFGLQKSIVDDKAAHEKEPMLNKLTQAEMDGKDFNVQVDMDAVPVQGRSRSGTITALPRNADGS